MELGQYYTPKTYSTLLISNMHSIKARNVLDIGCGQASLLQAARERWGKAKLIGYDIDPANYNLKGKNLHIGFGNGLDPDLSNKILDTFGSIDVSVANPPYTSVEVNRNIISILKLANLYDCVPKNIKKISAEIIFLAQNLLVLKDDGELGAILPASLISGDRWKGLREYLITEKHINKVIQLPPKAFNKTEVTTFALILTNKKTTNQHVNLLSFGKEITLGINGESGIKRLDYNYHSSNSHFLSSSLLDDVTIFRGNRTSKNLRIENPYFLHTSDLKDVFQKLSFNCRIYPKGIKTAKEGDFVISRVGSRCIGKAAYIIKGTIEISDCIVVLRNLDKKKFMKLFDSGTFYEKALCNALGTGAKYLTFDIIKEAVATYEF